MIKKKKEGHPLPNTPDMKAWREEFDELTIEDHDKKLKALGLDDEDIEEFNEDFTEEDPKAKKQPKK